VLSAVPSDLCCSFALVYILASTVEVRGKKKTEESEDRQFLCFSDLPSLVPRPSHRPVFDHLQYAKMEGEGLVSFIT